MGAGSVIQVAWLLSIMELGSFGVNPLLPKILIELSKFSRPGKPLTQEELIMLSQVDTFAKDCVRCGDLPDAFEKIIPEKVSNMAHKVFK